MPKNWKFRTPYLWILITHSKQDTVCVCDCVHTVDANPLLLLQMLYSSFFLSLKFAMPTSLSKSIINLKLLTQCAEWSQFELEYFCLEMWHQIKKLYPFSVFHPNKPCTQLAGQPQARSQKGCRAKTLSNTVYTMSLHSPQQVLDQLTPGNDLPPPSTTQFLLIRKICRSLV